MMRTMTEDDINLLERATGIPCKTPALIEKAQKTALDLSEDVLEARVGNENIDDVLAICDMKVNGEKDLAAAAAVVSGEGELVEAEATALEERFASITLDNLEQMKKAELVDLAKELGLPTKGHVKELFTRIGEYLELLG